MPTVTYNDGRQRQVKNLDWLIRNVNQKTVLTICPDGGSQDHEAGGLLRAEWSFGQHVGGWRYETRFASWSVLRGWADRFCKRRGIELVVTERL